MTEQQHPLTDELIKSWIHESNHNEPMFPQVARFGADWQLDQVIHFLEVNKDLSVKTLLRFIRPALRSNQGDTPWLDITYDGFNDD